MVDAAAKRICGRRIALVTEGGYDLDALRDAIASWVKKKIDSE